MCAIGISRRVQCALGEPDQVVDVFRFIRVDRHPHAEGDRHESARRRILDTRGIERSEHFFAVTIGAIDVGAGKDGDVLIAAVATNRDPI